VTTAVSHIDDLAAALQAATTSPVLRPDHTGYAEALAGFNLALQHRPDLVLVAQSAADVALTVEMADARGIRVTAMGAGHGALAAQAGGIAVVTSGLAGVTLDADAKTARVDAGTTWQQVMDVVTPAGLAPLAGSSPLVGVVGYLLGGGLGPVARTFGYAADHVRSIELVDGRGHVLVADAETEPELFWALRGGKAGLGIVTSVTIDLFPVSTLYAGGLYFAAPDITTVLHGWLDWGRTIPETVSTSASVLRLPPFPEIPEPLRGQLVLHVRAAHVGDEAEGERLISPLRALATPIVDTIGQMAYADLPQIHNDPAAPMPYTEGGALLDHLDHDGVDALLELIGPSADVPLVAVELRQLGGALARQPQVPNAIPGRDADYTLHIIGAPVPELLDTVLPGLIQGTIRAMGPWLSQFNQPNFVGRANAAMDFAGCWSEEAAARLARVRHDVDPHSVFGFGGDPVVHDAPV